MILCSNPLAQYQAHKAEIDTAIQRVLDKGWYILGEETRAFEAEFAAYIGVAHGIGVGNGTDALHVALAACGIVPGDEVITVSHTAVATVVAIELCGATPVLVDIEPDYFTLDPAKLESAISPRTKAIIPVHLYGQPADLAPILEIAQRHGLRIIEDCAQAHGALYHGRRVGAWGDIACFSFYPTKNLGALGDGGMVVTNDMALAERARLLREYGWAEHHTSQISGWNSRLDELQSAVLRVKLRHLDDDNAKRARLAAVYDESLANTSLVLPWHRSETTPVHHLYVVRSSRRDELKTFLKEHGVGTLIHYPVPVHLQPAYRQLIRSGADVKETERAAGEVLSLPMYPELTEKEVQSVSELIRSFDAESHD
jgi:dTDP-4-amino-4,6-dideoxygalactose transaminase